MIINRDKIDKDNQTELIQGLLDMQKTQAELLNQLTKSLGAVTKTLKSIQNNVNRGTAVDKDIADAIDKMTTIASTLSTNSLTKAELSDIANKMSDKDIEIKQPEPTEWVFDVNRDSNSRIVSINAKPIK